MFLFALLLKLPEFFSDAFRFRRTAGLAGLAFPLGQIVVILLHNGFHLAEGPHKCLHIGVVFHFLMLRHTFTSNLLANGAAPRMYRSFWDTATSVSP